MNVIMADESESRLLPFLKIGNDITKLDIFNLTWKMVLRGYFQRVSGHLDHK